MLGRGVTRMGGRGVGCARTVFSLFARTPRVQHRALHSCTAAPQQPTVRPQKLSATTYLPTYLNLLVPTTVRCCALSC